jgi:hypothetical protein
MDSSWIKAMSTYQDIHRQIKKLSTGEQLQLLEELGSTIKELDSPTFEPETNSHSQEKPPQTPQSTIWEKMRTRASRIPAKDWEPIPDDGACQHDHYLYGTPKQET